MARHTVPRGMARTSMMAGWGFPLILLPVVLIPPVILAVLTINPLYLLLIPGGVMIARQFGDGKESNPRLTMLRWLSGSATAVRENGVEKVPALREEAKSKWALLHD